MTLHDIQVFIAVYEERSITKAANRLSMTQPGVSKSIKSIEEQYDQSLFLRDNKKIFPTPVARQCYEICLTVMQKYADLETALHHASPKAELIISCDKGIDSPIMPSVRLAFQKKYPDCRLVIFEAKASDVPRWVKEGKASIGILQMGCDLMGLEHELMGSDGVVCVCKKDYRLHHQGQEVLSLADLASENLILTAQGTGIRASLDRLSLEQSVVLKPLWTCLAGDNALSFAEQGFGIAILSDTFAAESLRTGRVRMIPTDFSIRRTFFIVRRGDLWKSAEEAFLIEECKQQWKQIKRNSV